MKCDITESDDGIVFAISGDVNVNHARELLEIFKTRIVPGARITVDLANSSECDTAFFQLLCSTHKALFAISGSMTVTSLSAELIRDASSGGFFRQIGCTGHEEDCFLKRPPEG